MIKRAPRVTHEGGEVDVNITPLLDIVFIMLIFFIVTATFIKKPGVDVNKPTAQSAKKQELVSILVAITADDKIWINQKEVSLDGVQAAVKRLRRDNPKGSAVIEADANADTRYLIEVLKQIRAAGVEGSVAVSAKQT